MGKACFSEYWIGVGSFQEQLCVELGMPLWALEAMIEVLDGRWTAGTLAWENGRVVPMDCFPTGAICTKTGRCGFLEHDLPNQSVRRLPPKVDRLDVAGVLNPGLSDN
jgi:hypothetical protein